MAPNAVKPSSLLSNHRESVDESRWHLAREYSFLVGETSRASARAELLRLMAPAISQRPERITTRRVMAWQLRSPRLVGAIRLQLELGFRATFTTDHIRDCAQRGIVRIAIHPDLEFPIGAALVLPTSMLPHCRDDLVKAAVPAPRASHMVLHALACHPTGIGAGRALVDAIRHDCAELPSCPRLITFSPLTGLRAQVIRAADDPATPSDVRAGLSATLHTRRYPAAQPAAVAAWLRDTANTFASSANYAAGRFHRATGGCLEHVFAHADSDDCDAMWMRAVFQYSA